MQFMKMMMIVTFLWEIFIQKIHRVLLNVHTKGLNRTCSLWGGVFVGLVSFCIGAFFGGGITIYFSTGRSPCSHL